MWSWLLREYYAERVFIDVTVSRVIAWANLAAVGDADVWGAPMPEPPPSQAPPRKGTGPRVDVERAAQQLSQLPHRLIAYRGADGLPVVVPVQLGGHDQNGLRVVAPVGVLPTGHRRAGLLGHSYRPQLVGLRTRAYTGWLQVDAYGIGTYAPHTSKGFAAPPFKNLLLATNGVMAKVGMWRARRLGVAEKLKQIAADPTAGP
jgi:hypothetical protein